MRSNRFYLPRPLAAGTLVELPPEASNHAIRVLRLRVGEPVILFNGEGGEFAGTLSRTHPATVAVGEYIDIDRESPVPIWLVQGVSRGERMEYTVQKAVELGVAQIVPVITERTVARLDDAKAGRRTARWAAIAQAAAEQTGRNRVPPIAAPRPLSEWLAQAQTGSCVLLDPEASNFLVELTDWHAPVILLIGPEGGLSDSERRQSVDSGYRAAGLGPRLLRTETAGMVALALLQACIGDLGPPADES